MTVAAVYKRFVLRAYLSADAGSGSVTVAAVHKRSVLRAHLLRALGAEL